MTARTTLVAGWAIISCLLAGAIAAGSGMPSLWGGGSGVFAEYALPLPMGWGLMHVPGLVAFGLLLSATAADPSKWRPAAQRLALGTLIGVGVAALLIEAIRGLPLLMYLCVDAITLLAVTTFIPAGPTNAWSPRARLTMVVAPAALVIVALLISPLIRDRYRVSMTDTVESARGESLRVFVVLQGRRGDPLDECEDLKSMADRYRHRFTRRGTDQPMDGVVLLFTNADQISRSNGGGAWVRYRWQHGSEDRCQAGALVLG